MHLTCLTLLFVTVLANDLEGPKNVAVTAGQAAQMICANGTEAQAIWFYTSLINGVETILYDSKNILIASFSNTNVTGRVRGQILDINPVKLENSGSLKCVVNGVELVAQLIVLESKPVCGKTPNVSHQGFVDLWCRVNFTGFWPPNMQWMTGDKRLTSHLQRTSTSVSSTLTVEVDLVGANISYVCRTYFAAEDNTLKDELQTAKNVPNFTSVFTADVYYNSTTEDPFLIGKSTTRQSPMNTNGIMWILTSCAAVACLAVLTVIVYYVRKHPDVCKKSSEPDIVPNADVILIGGNRVPENRIDVHPPAFEPGFEAEELEQMHDNNVDYAEVVSCERRLPSNMQDSPAWNNVHNGACSKSFQNSPAWSHSSKGFPQSSGATPRKGSPMMNSESVEYLDINSVATIPVPYSQTPRRPPARLPTLQAAVSYASIDHTSRPPPPLPPSDDY